MTKINRLVMKGFKSFANKVELVFGDNFNCILGPNGSGKSNVLDALCFVLGKSSIKGMRAEKSANLIYNGGKRKSPAKEGIVSIYFDNSKKIFGAEMGEELEVTRIVRPTGQSKYKINGKTVTRQQILDLLSRARINPDGHNIILQGDIVQLVEMTPMERRGMIEEIAGISVYEDKKIKAIRELSRVEEKINEATIILAERETYIKELKKERNQAMRFRDLNDKIKQNKATSLNCKIKNKKSKADELDKRISENNKKIETLKKEIEKLRETISKKKLEIETINKEVEEKGETGQVSIHKETEKLKVDSALNKQRIETIETEIKKIGDRKAELEESYKELLGKITVLEKTKKEVELEITSKGKDLAIVEKKIVDFRKKNKLEDAQEIDTRVSEIDKLADELQDETHTLREKQQGLLRDKDRLELTIQSIDDKIEKVIGIEKENKVGLEKLKSTKEILKKKTNELNNALDYDSSLAEQLGTARDKLLSKKEQESELKARSASLRESLAGGIALKKIMELKAKGTIQGIIGTVSELGQVKDEYAFALEVAAGPRLGSVVVETDSVAAKCIKYLKDNKLGIATFLPLNKLKPRHVNDSLRKLNSTGVKGLAIDLITFPEKYRTVFSYVFGSTLVVESVETARKVGIGKERMVTLTGDLVETSGAMQGGFRQRRKGIGFQDKKIGEDIKKLEIEIKDLVAIVANLDVKKKNNEVRIDDIRKEKAEHDAEVIKLEKTLHIDSADLDASKKAKENIDSELQDIDKGFEIVRKQLITKNTELTELKKEKQTLRDKLTKLRSPSLLAELNSFEQKKAELKEEMSGLQSELRNNESEIKNILGPEGENIQKILKQHDREKEDFQKEKNELQKLIKSQESDLREMDKKQTKFYAQFKALFNSRTKLSDEVSKLEGNVQIKDNSIRELELKNNTLGIDNAGVKAEIAGLNEEFKQYEGVPLFKDKSEEQIEREIKQFEKMVSDIGAVNMKALEIYEKAETEFHALLKKRDKLTTEREDVLVMINEIDSKKTELFMRTYEVLNDNFKRIFNTLTTKGDASFELEDKNDPFAGGMTIKVRITGKKFMDIRSLSGGEKTLTALAFIFAVQEYAPASFYIMDEVDAALDKHNSEKLSKLVRSYCQDAQYLIISHNDAVISEADNLYGVSMDKDTISKVTTLKI
ncbi:MAG: chromosome segregation protein SMC [Nanoarchaeota archaeon]|nr:chromosome segregation protein SMC [Nanoarchaeota archaeon]MBU1322363.1 chromosome segregation protein SMC [Nanoarchaeota archaeon]MBU1598390.1 chromosome segregation protein SMC [Nanoarchaeota archaeon]MBU2440767.1 chromosome segregation protein SMC [Nanoarchaeota archaeon]